MTSMGPPFEIGKRLGSVRAQRGLSQGTVSRLAGLAPSYLSKIENGRIQPTFPTLWRILRALHADAAEVLSADSGEPRHSPGCPISVTGECLGQLIRSEAEVARDRRRVFVSTREVRLLHDLLGWLKRTSPEHARALETVLEQVLHAPPSGS
ncbi:MAG TPA: helix-turn-helix domain-containing protein [Candidatus Polarisedimenticolaceae bacterium]|nr:helix-turn-helix domain-containing protein [Candidatus Polarisedimenticolaceae bacterium]